MMKKVLGIGTAYVDYFYEADDAWLTKHSVLPEDDRIFDDKLPERVVFDELKLLGKGPGGSFAHTLKGLQSQGIATFAGCIVGNDTDGEYWKKEMEPTDTSLVITKNQQSICACVLSNKRHKRAFISKLNMQDNDFFTTFDPKKCNDFDLLHISNFFLDPKETLKKLAEFVKDVTIPISFSHGITYPVLGMDLLSPILSKTTIVFANEEEIRALTKSDIQAGSRWLLSKGPQIVVCTLGEQGVLVTTKSEQFYATTTKVQHVVDATGAGDAFAAGFLCGWLQNKSIRTCAAYGNKMGGAAITNFGNRYTKTIATNFLQS